MNMIKSFQNLALAIALIIVGTLIFPDLAQADEIGGIDFNAYCSGSRMSWTKAELVEYTPWGWKCYSQVNGSASIDIDVDEACRLQYGSSDVYALAKDLSDPFSWVCISGQPPV
jgi:hypothetical protein